MQTLEDQNKGKAESTSAENWGCCEDLAVRATLMLKEYKHIHYALQRVPTLVMQHFAYDLLQERAIGLYKWGASARNYSY